MSKLMKVLKMKKFLVITISALLVVSMAAVIAVIATTYPALIVSSPTIYYDGNREVTVGVSLPEDSSYAIATARLKIGFDPTVMSCTVNEADGTSSDISWNANGMASAHLISVNSHLTYLSLAWANTGNITYTTTSDHTAWLVKVNFTLTANAPAGEYPLTMSFPDSGTYAGNMVNAAGTDVPTDLANGKLTINPIPITYTASITGLTGGQAVYGTTLGASAVSIADGRVGNSTTYTEDLINHFTYQWRRDGVPIYGETNATYSPSIADIEATDSKGGGVLSVTIGASGNFSNAGMTSSEVKAVRADYSGTVPTPILVSRATASITLGISDATLSDSDCQFRMGTTGTWQDSTTFTNLNNNTTTYTFYARAKKTSTCNESAAGTASDGMKVQLPVTGTLGISNSTPKFGDTLTANTSALNSDFVTNGLSKATYTWYRDGVAAESAVGTGSSYTIGISDVYHTLTLCIRAVDDFSDPLWGFVGGVYSSPTAAVAKADNTTTPDAPTVNSNTYVNVGGLVINIQANQEYKITQAGSTVSDWTSYTGTTAQFTTGNTAWLKPATDYVITTRFKATDTQNTGTVEKTLNVTTAKWQLTTNGLSTSPTGNWKYGTQITATGSTSPIEANASLIYQWYRDNSAITGANTNVYTPVLADIGKTLKVELTVGGSYEWDVSLNKEVHCAVSKADGPAAPAAPELNRKGYDFIELKTVATNQYAITQTLGGTLEWYDGASISVAFYSLTPNTTYYAYSRVKATDTQKESNPCTTPLTVTTDKQPLGGSVSISVSGDAEWGKTLTANTNLVTPTEAVPYLVYNWYSGDDLLKSGSGWTNASYVTTESDCGKNIYLSLGVQSSCSYTIGTSIQSAPVKILAQTISGTASINGLAADGAEWGSSLSAVTSGVLPAPALANITYSWSVGGTEKATTSTYTPASADVGSTLTLTLGGSGTYRGTVSTTATIRKQTITAKPTVVGSPTFGSTVSTSITAIPAGAQTGIGYQWYRSTTETGTGTPITGAITGTYTINGDDIGKWIYVAVTVDSANAAYRGTTRSTAVEGGKEIITATIGITGTAKYGEELTITIGSLTPGAATYDVIWYRDGAEIKRGDSATAANKKYTLVQADIGTVISATIIGTGNYTGSPTAAQTATVTKADGPAKPAAPTAISNTYNTITVTGIAGYAYKLGTGGWGATRTSNGTFDFTGLSPNTPYSVYCYIPETDTHFASVSSDAVSVTTQKQPISGSVSITGILTYGEDLLANVSSVLPAGAKAGLTYAWYRGDSAAMATEAIGNTTSTLTLGASEVGKYIKVIVTGTGDYTGTLSATSSAAVAKANTSAPGTPTLSSKGYDNIQINSVVTNQYAITRTLGGALSWYDGTSLIVGFNNLLPNTTYYVYARVKETATNNASSACTTPLEVKTDKQPLGGAVTISGTTSYGDILTAVTTAVTPVDAQTHLTYQWYRVNAGTPSAITGANGQTYTIGASDIGFKIRVRVTAEANCDFTSYVESSDTVDITKKTVTGSISITGGAYYGDTLSVLITNVAPSGSQGTLTYQWQRYYNAGAGIPGTDRTPTAWQDIVGATNPTYTVTGADIGTSGGEPIQLRVVVTGDDINYIGSIISGSVTPGKKVISGTISITGTVRYGSTVTASDEVLPGPANAEMSYRWFVDGVEIAGRTGSTFNINDASWIGKTLTVEKYVSTAGSNYTGSVASAGKVIGKTANPGTTVPVEVLSFDKTSITIRVVHGQIYSIDGGLTWTGDTFDGVFRDLKPGVTYTIMTKIPGSETVDDSTTLLLTIQTQPDAVNVTYEFYDGIIGTVIVPSRVEIGTKATVQVIAPSGYHLSEIFDAMPNGVKLTANGNDTFTFIAGKQDIRIFIAFAADASAGGKTSSVTSSYTYSVPLTVSSKASSAASAVSSSQTTGSTGSDVNAPNMGENGMSANAAGIAIALFAIFGIALVVIEKRKVKN